jgi:uncharacterized protein YndB with AHSA1/START domain/DNA-binding transcriptional ArsR family regulator
MNLESVFKALADEHRRTLLDLLFVQDGQTLKELEAHLPMTRFGCMKHLQVLEDAGLITTRKIGREKLHHLNPIPIQMLYERWVSKYAQPWAQYLTQLKQQLEAPMKTPAHIQQIFIQTTAAQLWQALTDGAITPAYYMGTKVESDWQPGSTYRYLDTSGGIVQGGGTMLQGKVLEVEAPNKLVTSFEPLFAFPEGNAPISKVTFEIEAQGDVCKLTLTHEDLEADSPFTQNTIGGWTMILSGLKTLLETGKPMTFAASM